MEYFSHLLLAGTFDHLHLGHKHFIQEASQKAKKFSLGLCSSWVKKKKKFSSSLQTTRKRLKSLKNFLKEIKIEEKTKIFLLKDKYGPSVFKNDFDALAVSDESLEGGLLVNQKRKNKGLKPLKLAKISLIHCKDKQKLSSSRIRAGEIDRQGFIYQDIWHHKSFYLPEEKKPYFRKPLGKILKGGQKNLNWAVLQAKKKLEKNKGQKLVITVGDISTSSFFLNNLPFDLAVYDRRCQRKPLNLACHHFFRKKAFFWQKTFNQPSTISNQSLKTLSAMVTKIIKNRKNGLVEVEGEEDLLVLPLILLAPLKSLIFYGQPQEGLVMVEVLEKIKHKSLLLFKKLQQF